MDLSGILDGIGQAIENALEWLVNLLPDSPFRMLDNTPIQPYLKYINWVIPIDFMLDTLTLWLVAVAGYYCWRVVLRWVKAID